MSKELLQIKSIKLLIDANLPISHTVKMLYLQKIINKRQYTEIIEKSNKGFDTVNVLVETIICQKWSKIYLFFSNHHTPSYALDMTFNLCTASNAIKKNFFKKLTYPVLLFLGSYIFLFAAKTTLFAKLFEIANSMRISTETLYTCYIIISSIFYLFTTVFILIIAIICIFVLNHFQYINDKKMRSFLKIPLIKQTWQKYETYYFLMFFSTLVERGVSTIETFLYFKKYNPNRYLNYTIESCIISLANGLDLPQVIESQTFFTDVFKRIVELGYSSGQLCEALDFYQKSFEQELSNKIIRFANFLQYSLFALTALIIIFIYYSMLVPLLDITTQF